MKNQQTPRNFSIPSIFSLLRPKNKKQFLSEDIVIFSPVRWEHLRQRPQHVAALLSRNHKVLYIEEPLPQPKYTTETRQVYNPAENLTVIQPYSDLPAQDYNYTTLLNTYSALGAVAHHPLFWFYSPTFMDILHFIEPAYTVYDIADKVPTDEDKVLLSFADIVFTASKKVNDSVKPFNEKTFLIPNSVDEAHFRLSHDTETIIPPDLLDVPIPRIGLIGTLDKRIDADLIKKTAQSLPKVSFVFVGPMSSGFSLPKLPNIYYLGAKRYENLPNYLKGIDITFAPYNIKTPARFMYPLKIMEYMASAKPVICTPLYDVIREYSEEVKIVADAQEATRAIELYLNENAKEKQERLELQAGAIARTSWANTVARMENTLLEAAGEG